MARVASGGGGFVAGRPVRLEGARPRGSRFALFLAGLGVLAAVITPSPGVAQQFVSTRFSAHVTAVNHRTVDLTLSYVPPVQDSSTDEFPSVDPVSIAVFEGRREVRATPRALTPETLDVMVVADTYRSAEQLEDMQEAIAGLVDQLPAGSRIGVIEASTQPRVVLAPTAADPAVLEASSRLEPATEHALIAGIGEAAEQFSPTPGRRRAIVAFGVTYQYDQRTVDDVRAKLRTADASIYLFSSDRSVVGSGVGEFPLPLGGGRESFGFDLERFVTVTAATLRDQYAVSFTVSGRSNPTSITVRARAGDETVSTRTPVRLPQSAVIAGGEPSSRRAQLRTLAVALFVVVAAVTLVCLPRIRRRRRERRRSTSPPVPVTAVKRDDVAGEETTPSRGTATAPVWQRAPDEPDGRERRPAAPDVSSSGGADGRDRQSGASLGGDQVEGRAAVRALLRARPRLVRSVWISEGMTDDEVMAQAAAARVTVQTVRHDILAITSRSGASEGVIAEAAPLFPIDPGELAARISESGGLVLVVDGVLPDTDLAALFRLADSVGAGLVLTRERSVPISPPVAAAALGAIERVPVALVASAQAAVSLLRSLGCVAIGVEATDPLSLGDGQLPKLDLTSPVALVLHPVGRLPGQLRASCDGVFVADALPDGGAGILVLAQAGLTEVGRLRPSIEA